MSFKITEWLRSLYEINFTLPAESNSKEGVLTVFTQNDESWNREDSKEIISSYEVITGKYTIFPSQVEVNISDLDNAFRICISFKKRRQMAFVAAFILGFITIFFIEKGDLLFIPLEFVFVYLLLMPTFYERYEILKVIRKKLVL